MARHDQLERSIDRLLKRMTLTEKVALLSGKDYWHTTPVPRLAVGSVEMHDGPFGVCGKGEATRFPAGVSLAATWNTELIHRVAGALGEESLATQTDVLLGPCVNIVRHPIGGRNFESFSEDPCLAGELGVAYVQGLQSRGVGASVKHFACNNQELNRERGDSLVDERTLREIYLPHFEAIVKRGRPWTVMCAYNRINGQYASEQRHLLTEILKKEWGFDGVVVSDWGANHTVVESIQGGLDLEMPGPAKYYGSLLVEAVNNWQIEPAAVDEAARRVLRLVARVGKIGRQRQRRRGSVNTVAHQDVACQAAAEAVVLLKNEGPVLPLDLKRLHSLAVIGPTAEIVPTGGGSSKNQPPRQVSLLAALRAQAGKRLAIHHAAGCDHYHSLPLAETGWLVPPDGKGTGWLVEYYDGAGFAGKPVAVERKPKYHFWHYLTPPAEGVDPSCFSARWRATLTVPHTCRFRFKLECTTNSQASLRVNGRGLLQYTPEAGSESLPHVDAEIELLGGRPYQLSIETTKLPGAEAAYGLLHVSPCAPVGYEPGVRKAAELAARCDAAIICVGLPEDLEGEMQDRPHLELPGAQAELIRAVAKANPRSVVVIYAGAPVRMPWREEVPAIVLGWYPGQEGGTALARILTGMANPSGKLPATWPKRLEDTPAFGFYSGGRTARYGEGILVGYRHYDARDIEPMFPFGYGLSYTTFKYSGLRAPKVLRKGDSLKVELTVKNTGLKAGAEVVQLYVGDIRSSLFRPPKELKGFRKVLLRPGEVKRVAFTLNERDLSFYDPVQREWIAEAGEFEMLVGASSRDIRLRRHFSLIARKGLGAVTDR